MTMMPMMLMMLVDDTSTYLFSQTLSSTFSGSHAPGNLSSATTRGFRRVSKIFA